MTASKNIAFWQVDAFADRVFTGNPAAVCILDSYPGDGWMQSVAEELNLSETSFIVPTGVPNTFQLRWFTPAIEVDLCGHATLAAAHILIQQRRVETGSPIRFQTRSGELPCSRSGSRITLDFPSTPAAQLNREQDCRALLAALRLDSGVVLKTKFDLLVVVDDATEIEAIRPDFTALEAIPTRGIMVSAASQEPDIDFVSRFFAPRCGVNEDPVTGSAHCCLAPFWAERLGKTSLVGYQASKRGGLVYCEVSGDRVRLTGTAATVFEGRMLSQPE